MEIIDCSDTSSCKTYINQEACSTELNMNPICSHCINQEECLSNPLKIENCLGSYSKEDCSDTSSSCPTTGISSTPSCSTCQSKGVCDTGSNNPLDKQVGGNHYKDFKIQPIEFFMANQTPYAEAAIIKYVMRHKMKGGKEDLKKAIHLCELLIKENYGWKH